MTIDNYEKAGNMAQKISFAFEDSYGEAAKQKMFMSLFDDYLLPIDPGGRMEPYDAIILLWRSNRPEFDVMVSKMIELKLIDE